MNNGGYLRIDATSMVETQKVGVTINKIAYRALKEGLRGILEQMGQE